LLVTSIAGVPQRNGTVTENRNGTGKFMKITGTGNGT
jgi:hypothetical protein